jgi:hypothetical protein
MTIIRNQRGIALVLVMILALIGLAIVSALIFMGTMGTRLSGAEKFYRNSDEAASGGARVAADMVITNFGNSILTLPSVAQALGGSFGTAAGQACLIRKMNNATAAWGGGCTGAMRNMDPADNWDMTFPLSGAPNNYAVFAKVVDTIEGNTSGVIVGGGGTLTTGGVGGGGASVVTPPRHSWMYRIEVQAEDSVSPRERAMYSILYAH